MPDTRAKATFPKRIKNTLTNNENIEENTPVY